MQNESVTLYYRDHTSDKVYQAQIAPEADGFAVRFQYGRRGSTMTAGTKTPAPLPFEKAKKIYDALVKSKTAKGYTPTEGGVPYQASVDETRVTGLDVQVLTPVAESEVASYISNDAYVAQEKYDGERRPVANRQTAIGSNKRGLEIALPIALAESVALLSPGTELDCEQVGDKLYAFDLLRDGENDVRQLPYITRYGLLLEALRRVGASNIEAAPIAFGTPAKRALFERLKAGKEGIVFKRADAPYKPGNGKNLDQVKFKFVESATVEVAAVHASKRSVTVQVYDDAGNVVTLGSVSIGVDKDIPALGDIVEVQYLYCMASLIQSVYIGKRTDQNRASCTVAQLKYKSATIAA